MLRWKSKLNLYKKCWDEKFVIVHEILRWKFEFVQKMSGWKSCICTRNVENQRCVWAPNVRMKIKIIFVREMLKWKSKLSLSNKCWDENLYLYSKCWDENRSCICKYVSKFLLNKSHRSEYGIYKKKSYICTRNVEMKIKIIFVQEKCSWQFRMTSAG